MVKWERGKIGMIQIKGTLRKQMEVARRMRRRYSIMVTMNNVVLRNRRKCTYVRQREGKEMANGCDRKREVSKE